jgi:hypothetical protein
LHVNGLMKMIADIELNDDYEVSLLLSWQNSFLTGIFIFTFQKDFKITQTFVLLNN